MRNRTFKLRDDETLYQMMRMYNNYSGQFRPFYNEQNELYDFTVAALQWDKAVRDQVRKEGRPANSYNLIRTIINVIFSVERDNRKKGKASPRHTANNNLANVVTQTLDYYMYRSKFDEAAVRVFMDQVIGRFGVYHLGWNYEGSEDDRGSLFVSSADPREFVFEPNFNDPIWEDSSMLYRKHQMNIDEILNRFALNDEEMETELMKEAAIFYQQDVKRDKWISKRLKALFSAVYETATGYSSGSGDNIYQNYLQWWDQSTGKFDILELHEKRTERRLIIPDSVRKRNLDITDVYFSMYKELEKKQPDGFTFDRNVVNELKKRYNLQGSPRADLAPRRFQTIVIPAFNIKIDERAYPMDTQTYVYIPQYCYDFHPDPLKLQSLMDDLKDPQADFNKSMSLILELTARYSNNGWVMDENAIAGLEADWQNNKIAPFRRVRAGYINQIKPEQSPKINDELIKRPVEMQQIMKVISNAEDEIRGNASQNVKSGKHFIAKEKRQAKSYTYILENRDRAQRAVHQLALDLIQHFATTQQVIRIVGEHGFQEGEAVTINQSSWSINETGQIVEKVLNDIDSEKFDIEITDEPYSASAQEEKYQKLGDLFNATAAVNPQKADALLDIFVEVGNFPKAEEILKAWQALKGGDPQQQQQQQMMQMIQQIMIKLGIEEKKADIAGKKLENAQKVENLKQSKAENILGMLGFGQQQEQKSGAGAQKNGKNGKAQAKKIPAGA